MEVENDPIVEETNSSWGDPFLTNMIMGGRVKSLESLRQRISRNSCHRHVTWVENPTLDDVS